MEGSEVLRGGWWDWVPKSIDHADQIAYEVISSWLPLSWAKTIQQITESHWVSLVVVLLFVGYIFGKKYKWRYQFVIALGLLLVLDFFIDSWLKDAFGRIKPYLSLKYTPAHHAALSFPSAHAANFGFMAAYLKRYRRPALVFLTLGLIVAASRVISGRHYPLDVLGGLLLGGGMGWICQTGYYWVKKQFFMK
jgi:undecaprenyl-diphosphatase